MLDIDQVDLSELAEALQDQTDYDHHWLIDPKTGEFAFWTRDCGIDGQNPIELDELEDRGLLVIQPLPSYVWYEDMADFAAGLSDESASRRLERAIRGRGAFRRFKDELHEEYPELAQVWYSFQDARAKHRAVVWLVDNSVVTDDAAEAYLAKLEDPELP
ncbi:MAG: UPF0158 family protein [Pseudonocardiaceae bacterium]